MKQLNLALVITGSILAQAASSSAQLLSTSAPSASNATSTSTAWATKNSAIFNSLSDASIIEALNSIWKHGLNPKVYLLQTAPMTREDLLNSYYNALVHVATGVTDPMSLSSDIKIKKKSFFTDEQLMAMVLSNRGNAEAIINSVAPQSSHYFALQSALQKLYPILVNGGWSKINQPKVALKLGVKNAVIPTLKDRLRIYGFPIDNSTDIFDNQMLNAINDIQLQFKMKPDGIMSPDGKTWTYFQVSTAERIQQIQADMEKLRWIPQRLEDRHIFVNTAFSHFTLIDRTNGQNFIMSFKTINGSAERKTPVLRDRMTYLVLNPTWTVPPTVFIKDKVEAIKNLNSDGIADYFAKNNFQVYNSTFTRTIDPRTINWKNINSSNVDFYIRQKPNYMNALGVVKFMLTNPYAIYLHDTNQRELFGETMRQRSSGCIRLEKPIDLAEYMLRDTDWSRAKIEDFVAKPNQVILDETRVNIKNPIPVYLMPITSQLTSDGVLRFVEDSYKQNTIILTQLRGLGK